MRSTLVGLLVALAVASCTGISGGDECGANAACGVPPDAVPEEFRDACGSPGSIVEVRSQTVTVKHADCDLTGVTLRRNGVGAVVPPAGQGVSNSGGIAIMTESVTNDVTFTAES